MKSIAPLLAAAAVLAAVLVGAPPAGLAQAPATAPADPAAPVVPPAAALTDADRAFLTAALESGAAEVRMSELAVERAKAGRVQDFARRMVEDHGPANQQLADIARGKGVEPPGKPSLDKQHVIEQLDELAGSEFDTEYMAQQVTAHEDAVALYEAQLAQTEDADLRAFAEAHLPMLQEHLDAAREMNEQVKEVAN